MLKELRQDAAAAKARSVTPQSIAQLRKAMTVPAATVLQPMDLESFLDGLI
jgi:hypothetical protein